MRSSVSFHSPVFLARSKVMKQGYGDSRFYSPQKIWDSKVIKTFIGMLWFHQAILPLGLRKHDLCPWGTGQGSWTLERLYQNVLSPFSTLGHAFLMRYSRNFCRSWSLFFLFRTLLDPLFCTNKDAQVPEVFCILL